MQNAIPDKREKWRMEMIERTAQANWRGDLKSGSGKISFGNGRFKDEPYSAPSRFGDEDHTNPEELIAAAHASCFSMALSHALTEAGKQTVHIHTEAKVHLEEQEDGYAITSIFLKTEAKVPHIEEDEFKEIAEDAKDNCPVSKALAGCDIQFESKLVY
jgi:osmotically inducible protein OsmC